MEDLKINCDGGARGNPGPAAAAFVVSSVTGKKIFSQGSYLGVATNNQAEYQAVLQALHWLVDQSSQLNPKRISFFLDSQLVVNQLNGSYKIKDQHLLRLSHQVQELLSSLGKQIQITFTYVPRSQNSAADLLVNQTLDALS